MAKKEYKLKMEKGIDELFKTTMNNDNQQVGVIDDETVVARSYKGNSLFFSVANKNVDVNLGFDQATWLNDKNVNNLLSFFVRDDGLTGYVQILDESTMEKVTSLMYSDNSDGSVTIFKVEGDNCEEIGKTTIDEIVSSVSQREFDKLMSGNLHGKIK